MQIKTRLQLKKEKEEEEKEEEEEEKDEREDVHLKPTNQVVPICQGGQHPDQKHVYQV